MEKVKAVVTDSGGITEEASIMNIPCMTLRDNTERPETIKLGTNELLGTNPKAIKPTMVKLFAGDWKKRQEIPMWAGKMGMRFIEIILKPNKVMFFYLIKRCRLKELFIG